MLVAQQAGGLGPQQSVFSVDFWQQAGGFAEQQFSCDDVQHPSGAAEVSSSPLQHGKQFVSVALGVQAVPVFWLQQPAFGPKPQPHCFAPVTPQQPRGSAGVLPTLEQCVPVPPPCTGLQFCVPALQKAVAPQVLQAPPPWQQQQQPAM